MQRTKKLTLTEEQISTAMDAAVARLIPRLSQAARGFDPAAVEAQRVFVEKTLQANIEAAHIDVGTAGTDILVILVNAGGSAETHEREIPAWLATHAELRGANILVAAETI